MSVLALSSELKLETRCHNQIENEINRGPILAGMQLLSDDLKQKYPGVRHRPTTASHKYNCNGLTFASRRTVISKAAEILMILRDDEYEEAVIANVMCGDIVVYIEKGEVEHSGIVVGSQEGVPMVLSKWGLAHEAVHRVNECPYNSAERKYYRITS